jgi:hypothetical protein
LLFITIAAGLKPYNIRNIKNLTAFVHDLRQEPEIFLELIISERNDMEQKMDAALAHFKD